MASATNSRPKRSERRAPHARVAEARALETPLASLAAARKAAPLLYLELTGLDGPSARLDARQRGACMRAVSAALHAATGSILRKRDVVAAGPGARWFVALLVDRAVAASHGAAVNDADLGVAATRLRAKVQSALDELRRRGELPVRVGVRAGWTIIEPRDAQRPLAELRHAVRGAAVVARVEERRAIVLAAITHELRTPLTSIIGFVERLADDDSPGAAARKRALTIVADESRRLSRLVEGLIDAGAWQAGSLTLRRRSLKLRTIVDSAVLVVGEAAQARCVKLRVRGNAEAVVDGDRIAQIVVNLLDNAVRHTLKGGAVRVSLDQTRDRAMLVVADDGDGLGGDLAKTTGLPFAVGADGRVGLGLAISRMLVDAHGGTLEIARARGGGVKATATLPRKLPRRRPQERTGVWR
jgi:signal transduction histidine kinase